MVEMNTIASSFGVLCGRVSDMHRYIAKRYSDFSPAEVEAQVANFANRDESTLKGIVEAFAKSYKLYGETKRRGVVVVIIGNSERNCYD